MNGQCFYTTGCANKNIADLPALVERHDAHLADIRFSVDHASAAQPAELQRLLGLRYRRVTQLGARLSKTGETAIAHLTLGLRIVLSWQTNVIFLCECERLEDCHRALIARELSRQKFAVKELPTWRIEPPRVTTAGTVVQELQTSIARNEAGRRAKTESAPPPGKTSAPHLEAGPITLRCGTPENVQTKTVEGLSAAGLGIHLNHLDSSLHAITHLATGRRICTAETLNQAKAILNQLLQLGVDWSHEVPWQTDAEAHRLKQKINRILLAANKD